MSKDTGGPAFPVNELNQQTGAVCAQNFGLTLRDYFAAKAMQGMLSAFRRWPDEDDLKAVSRLASKQADAMLAERNKQ